MISKRIDTIGLIRTARTRVAASATRAARGMAILLLGSLLVAKGAAATTASIAGDLKAVIAAPATPMLSWAKDINGVRYVKVLIFSSSTDPDLTALRQSVLAAGGSVFQRYVSVAGLSAILPASQVGTIAALSQVQSISPNRLTSRTASAVQSVTGAANMIAPGAKTASTGYDGTGVGIAVLDSGIDRAHAHFKAASGSRVARSADFQLVGDLQSSSTRAWTIGVDRSASLYPGSLTMAAYETLLAAGGLESDPDPYGHGSHVAGIAAGNGTYQAPDASGVAPNATLYSVRVLGPDGTGELADVLAGIDWVIYHARKFNIRVMNLSLASDSTESYLTDPICRAVRSAESAGIAVVVAAGNFGQSAAGATTYGSISAPGNEPSVITVGSANLHGSLKRSAATINHFSSRGPTTSGYVVDASGNAKFDNVLKPDLVAPGNAIVSVLSADVKGDPSSWNLLASTFPQLAAVPGAAQAANQTLMMLSGTSIAAPAVTGTVALMVQANPGLTPPLIKAILQYSAQPLAGYSLVDQGAGLLNVDGAVRLAAALRTDIATAISGGTINPGDKLLAATMPAETSTVDGESFAWGRVVFTGGNQVVSGDALFTAYQPIWDPRIHWVNGNVWFDAVSYWPATSTVPANTYVQSIVETPLSSQALLGPGTVLGSGLAGTSSLAATSGDFVPVTYLSSLLASGSSAPMTQGIVLNQRVVLAEGIALSIGCVLSERVVLSEGIVTNEGVALAQRVVLSESGDTAGTVLDASVVGEP